MTWGITFPAWWGPTRTDQEFCTKPLGLGSTLGSAELPYMLHVWHKSYINESVCQLDDHAIISDVWEMSLMILIMSL